MRRNITATHTTGSLHLHTPSFYCFPCSSCRDTSWREEKDPPHTLLISPSSTLIIPSSFSPPPLPSFPLLLPFLPFPPFGEGHWTERRAHLSLTCYTHSPATPTHLVLTSIRKRSPSKKYPTLLQTLLKADSTPRGWEHRKLK